MPCRGKYFCGAFFVLLKSGVNAAKIEFGVYRQTEGAVHLHSPSAFYAYFEYFFLGT